MRPARAVIDLQALRHNFRLARSRHGGRVLAVVKANAYGHGAIRCAAALAPEADGFAVACVEEAELLRQSGVESPILLLEGVFGPDELAAVDGLGLWMVVHHDEQLRMLDGFAPTRPLNLWLKFNTGMNRAGFPAERARELYARLEGDSRVGAITLMSHFARADELDCSATAAQIERFRRAITGLTAPLSLCNSAGILGWPAAHADWARPGIMLYGADPLPDEAHGLVPVMTLESRVMAVRDLEPGEALGYGGRFVAERAMRVGLVAMGYADGYPRGLPDGSPLAVEGQPARLVGRVSMDMLCVDLSGLRAAGIGSRVELWGRQVSVNRVAAAAGTISYELLCNVKRVRFEYSG